MSKKARRRPSWGKYRQKYGKWAVYYQPTKSYYGIDCEEDLIVDLYEELTKEIIRKCLKDDSFYNNSLQKLFEFWESVDGDRLELPQEYSDHGRKWRWKIDPTRRPHFFPVRETI